MIGGGGAERNCRPLPSTNGVTDPQLVNTGAGNFGGFGRESPGRVPAMNGGGVAADPSDDRRPMSRLAAISPTLMPCCLPRLSGMAASSPASSWSGPAFSAGYRAASTS